MAENENENGTSSQGGKVPRRFRCLCTGNFVKGDGLSLPDKSIDFNMAMFTVFLRPKIRTILVSPSISVEEARTMGLEHSSCIKEGIKSLETPYPNARVAIFPSGGLIVPIAAWER